VTLRTRLVLALFVVALLPIAVFTTFMLDQLDRSAQRWYRPGIQHALESALEVARGNHGRIEGIALARAGAWAARWPARPLTDSERQTLRIELRTSGLDFVQLYQLEEGRWLLVEHLTPSVRMTGPEPDFGSDLPADLGDGFAVHSGQGAIAAACALGDGGAVVAGVWVAPDYFQQLADVGEGVNRYRQLGVLVPLQRRYVWLLVSGLVVGLAIAVLILSNTLARGISRPLGELSAALARVAGGDLAARIRPAGALEMRTLGSAFNQMTASLESARTSLQQAEREAAWREVARHLAHEIKNPLTPMRLSLHRMKRRLDSVAESEREAMRDSIEALVQEIEHLTRLAEQFAQYARLPEPRFEDVDIADIARRVAALYEPDQVTYRCEAPAPMLVRGDPLLLSRALHNLTLNACEAAGEGVPVEIVALSANGRAVVEILDRGPGLPEGPSEHLFEPYVSTKRRGSGLGLPLVRDIAKRHGGEATLENRENGGARARLVIPIGEEAGSRAANE
jgi:nitrogen fixation/metabolism regulation signal transduction histidine kinase